MAERHYTKEQMDNATNICRKSIHLHNQVNKTLVKLMVSIQMGALCTEGDVKGARLFCGGNYYHGCYRTPKNAEIIISNKVGKEFRYPIADCPHELRRVCIKNSNLSDSQTVLWRKEGWLAETETYKEKKEDGTENTHSATHAQARG